MKLLKRYPLTLLCVAAIWYLCFFKPPTTRLSHTPFIDKWVHILMYLMLSSSLWIEYLRSHTHIDYLKLCVGAIVLPIVLSGLIELGQAYCTTTRSGDWLDFLANVTGVGLGALLGFTVYRRHFLKKVR